MVRGLSTLLSAPRRLLRETSGATAILFALSLPVIAGFAGLGVEIGFWYSQKRLLQSASDAAAMAAGHELLKYLLNSNASYDMTGAAQRDVVSNGITLVSATGGAAATGSISQPATLVITTPTPPANSAGDTVSVLTQPQNTLISKLFLDASFVNVQVRSVARIFSMDPACIEALEQLSVGVDITGNANITLTKCGIVSNSSNSSSVAISGNAHVTTDYINAVGDVSILKQQNVASSNIVSNGPPAVDPFQYLTMPTTSGSSQTPPGPVSKGTTVTLNPGTYTNGLSLQGQGTVNLNPGVYVIDGGTLSINSGVAVTGTGVTFVLKNNASISINGSATVNLSAPADTGVLFYQVPGGDPSVVQTVNGGSNIQLKGAFYFPDQTVKYNGNNGATNACTRIVARVVDISGSASFGNDCTGYQSLSQP